MKWVDLARAAAIDPQTLRRYRIGERRTDDTTRAIELAFGWPRGHLDAIAAGEPPPIDAAHAGSISTDPEPIASADIGDLRAMLAELDQQADMIRRRLDELDNSENSARRGA